MFHRRYMQRAVSLLFSFLCSFLLLFPSLFLICFFSLVLQLKVILLFQMAWCYVEEEEYLIENMKICQHVDISGPKITSRPHGEK